MESDGRAGKRCHARADAAAARTAKPRATRHERRLSRAGQWSHALCREAYCSSTPEQSGRCRRGCCSCAPLLRSWWLAAEGGRQVGAARVRHRRGGGAAVAVSVGAAGGVPLQNSRAVGHATSGLLLLGELSSATSGSLTVALRAAASELRGHGVYWCRPARAWASTDGLFKHRCLSWRSDAVAQRAVAPLGLPARVDFWSAGRMQRCRPRDETDAGSPRERSGRTRSRLLRLLTGAGVSDAAGTRSNRLSGQGGGRFRFGCSGACSGGPSWLAPRAARVGAAPMGRVLLAARCGVADRLPGRILLRLRDARCRRSAWGIRSDGSEGLTLGAGRVRLTVVVI